MPPTTPVWIVVGHHDDPFHLWKEIHKDMAHQLNGLEKVEHHVEQVEHHLNGLSIQVEGVEMQVAEQEVVGNRVLRSVPRCIGAIHHQMAKTDFF